jgi:Cu2+-containing amine oxidase
MDMTVCHPTASRAAPHPLDPLTGGELNRAAQLIRDHSGRGADLRVETIDLPPATNAKSCCV